MMHETFNDPKHIWQSHRREHPVMSVELVRARANAAQRKARRVLIVTMFFAVLLMILGAVALVEVPPARIITAALMVVVLVAAWKAYQRISSPPVLADQAALNDCVSFYRRELETQYRNAYGSIGLTWRFAAALAFYAALTANIWAETVGPLIVRILIPALLILLIIVRHWESRRVKRELAALDEFEREAS